MVNRNNLRVCLTGYMIEHRNTKIRRELLLRKCQGSKGNTLLDFISTNNSKLNCLFSEILKYPLGNNWHNTSHHHTDNHFQNWQLSLQLTSVGSIFVSASSCALQGLLVIVVEREIRCRSAFLLTKAAAITIQLKRGPRNQPQRPGFFTQEAVALRRRDKRSISRCGGFSQH